MIITNCIYNILSIQIEFYFSFSARNSSRNSSIVKISITFSSLRIYKSLLFRHFARKLSVRFPVLTKTFESLLTDLFLEFDFSRSGTNAGLRHTGKSVPSAAIRSTVTSVERVPSRGGLSRRLERSIGWISHRSRIRATRFPVEQELARSLLRWIRSTLENPGGTPPSTSNLREVVLEAAT